MVNYTIKLKTTTDGSRTFEAHFANKEGSWEGWLIGDRYLNGNKVSSPDKLTHKVVRWMKKGGADKPFRGQVTLDDAVEILGQLGHISNERKATGGKR